MMTKATKKLTDAGIHIGDAQKDLSELRGLIQTKVSGNVEMLDSLKFIESHLVKARDEVLRLLYRAGQ